MRDKAFNGCHCGLVFMFYKFFDKKSSGSDIKNESISNRELAEELLLEN